MEESSRRNRLIIIWSVLTAMPVALFWLIYWLITKTMPVADILHLLFLPRYIDILVGPIVSTIFILMFFADKAKNKEGKKRIGDLEAAESIVALVWVVFFIVCAIANAPILVSEGSVIIVICYLAISIKRGFNEKESISNLDLSAGLFAFVVGGLVYGLVFGLAYCLFIIVSCWLLGVFGSEIGVFFQSKFWKRIVNFLLVR